MTAEEFVAEAKRAMYLRLLADEMGHAFMEFLLQVEGHPNIWHSSGMAYPEFIERCGLYKASRWTAWRRGRDRTGTVVGNVRAEQLDVEATAAIGVLTRDDDVREAVRQMEIWRTTNDTSVSPSAAKRIVRAVREAPT